MGAMHPSDNSSSPPPFAHNMEKRSPASPILSGDVPQPHDLPPQLPAPLITGLALELVVQIMSELHDMSELGSLILSHSSFYMAYTFASHHIVERIIRRQIPPNLWRDALLVHLPQRSEFDCTTLKGVQRFLYNLQLWFWEQHLLWDLFEYDETVDRTRVNIRLAGKLSLMHNHVDYFTKRFIEDARPLAHRRLRLPPGSMGPVSEDEIFRIHRALYRFQLQCEMLRHQFTNPEWNNVMTRLNFNAFDTYAAWVNEQLACIHHFLIRVLSEGKLTAPISNFTSTPKPVRYHGIDPYSATNSDLTTSF